MTQPILFVSYAHADADIVTADIAVLAEGDVNVWHDSRLTGGVAWREEIASTIAEARGVLCFLSANSVKSEVCQQELSFALDEGKPLLCVHLDRQGLSPGLRMSVGHRQGLHRHLMTQTEFHDKLLLATKHLLHAGPQDGGEVLGEHHNPSTQILPEALMLSYAAKQYMVPPDFGGIYSIGRNPGCQITIESMYVSQHHGVLRCHQGAYFFRDESRFGTTVVSANGDVQVHNAETMLPPKGELHMGDAVVEFSTAR